MGNIAPCVFPGCREVGSENPRLTRNTICDPRNLGESRWCRDQYMRVLDRLLLNYVLIRRDMPTPAVTGARATSRSGSREYGHPRPWASDTARDVADQLSEAHDALAELVGRDGPPWHGHHEGRRVAISHHFLTCWFDHLCTMAGAGDTALALVELDRDIRSGLGETRARRHIQAPCPECKALTLVRSIESDDDPVECLSCGHLIPPDRYQWWARTLLDEMIDAADVADLTSEAVARDTSASG